jgi:[protein-PII] uridylyltransferase
MNILCLLFVNLRRFIIDKHRDRISILSQNFQLIAKPEVLYLAALFHDIAKGLQR